MTIHNIIFDLGGVLLNIDYQATISEFKKLGVKNFDDLFTQAAQIQLFDQFDKGEISSGHFRDELRRISGLPLKDEEIDRAWNAMLFDLPAKRIALLELVRKNYRAFLLSNTNAIHYPAYMEYLETQYGFPDLNALFEKQYLSFRIGMRKPDKEVYGLILDENDLEPSETLLIDDSIQHVDGARDAGLHAVCLDVDNTEVGDLFNKNAFLSHPVPG